MTIMDQNKKEKIIRFIVERKVPVKDVASRLFMTERQLRMLLEAWGVEIPKKRKTYSKIPPPERQVLMTLYKKYGNIQKLAEHFGVGINTVNRWMRSLMIPTRKMKMSKEDKVKFFEEHIGRLDNISV